MTIFELINITFQNLQNLQLQPTEHNVEILSGSLKALREVYGQVETLTREKDELAGKLAAITETAEMDGNQDGNLGGNQDGDLGGNQDNNLDGNQDGDHGAEG